MNPLTLSRSRHEVLVECLAQRARAIAMSNHFTLYKLDPARDAIQPEDIIVVHDFVPAQIDNNIGYYVANELLPLFTTYRQQAMQAVNAYAYSEQEIFERYVGEIVRSMDGNERRAWHLYYDNTLTALGRLAAGQQRAPVADIAAEQDFIGNFGAIYRRAIDLIEDLPRATMLDVATCFGFLPLLIAARRGNGQGNLSSIVGCDLNPALVALADDYARQRQFANVQFIRADILAADVRQSPLTLAFDVVTAIHLLEHLEPEQTGQAMASLWQLTQQRLIVAVPLEPIPDARFGHRQVFNRERLLALGQQTGGNCRYFEYYGGWIVIDRCHEPEKTTRARVLHEL